MQLSNNRAAKPGPFFFNGLMLCYLAAYIFSSPYSKNERSSKPFNLYALQCIFINGRFIGRVSALPVPCIPVCGDSISPPTPSPQGLFNIFSMSSGCMLLSYLIFKEHLKLLFISF